MATLERTYNVPLRKEFAKVPNHKKTNKAVKALGQFISKHMKSDNVKIGKVLNEEMWKHGIKNPPHHVKVTAIKDDTGKCVVEKFGVKIDMSAPKPKKAKSDANTPMDKLKQAMAQDKEKKAENKKADKVEKPKATKEVAKPKEEVKKDAKSNS